MQTDHVYADLIHVQAKNWTWKHDEILFNFYDKPGRVKAVRLCFWDFGLFGSVAVFNIYLTSSSVQSRPRLLK